MLSTAKAVREGCLASSGRQRGASARGVNPRVVMETLGHSQISLTLNTYTHVLPALQRDAAARISAVLAR